MDWAETYDEAIESLLNMANDPSYTGKDLAEAIEDYREQVEESEMSEFVLCPTCLKRGKNVLIYKDTMNKDGTQKYVYEEESKTPLADKAIKELQQGYTEEESK